MTILDALFLGIIQGLCEFLPISSSGHLTLLQLLLHFDPSQLVLFNLMCHLGTLLASVIVFRKAIFTLFTSDRRSIPLFMLALLPLVPMYLLIKKVCVFSSVKWLGPFFIFTGFLLYITSNKQPRFQSAWPYKHNPKHAFLIGLFQSIALIPGISRSGTTLSIAKWLGWHLKDAVVFSYLLSMPAILGGLILESLSMPSTLALFSAPYLVGFASSFVVGFATIKGFLYFIEKHSLRPFAYYLLGLGLLTLYLFWI
jgi:undecaprenyl-diphosphatase